jgi:geranylgeranyl pyrophosphate synthase
VTSELAAALAFLESCAARTEVALDARLPSPQTLPQRLHEAMRYAVLGGGKRLRPSLVYAAGTALGVAPELLDAPACAVEIIHAYSLIHDDLPAMDDDDLRRGKPSCHKAFGEAIAILAGDALQALAFAVLVAEECLPAATRVRMARILADACGSEGMAGGQAIDLEAAGQSLELSELERMHRYKTGALIRAAVLMGAAAAGCAPDDARYQALARYGDDIGLAFQIRDDLLDVLGETAVIGKPRGSDAARGKPTYPAILGLEASTALAMACCDRALQALAGFDERADALRALAHYVSARDS